MNVSETDETISRLKFIGMIQKDEKINSYHITRQPNNVFTRFIRSFWYRDNRSNTLKLIRDVIDRSFEIAENVEFRGIIKDLQKAKVGINNLKETYCDDTKFCCDIDVILEHLSLRLEKFV
jgi:hypothetical protein